MPHDDEPRGTLLSWGRNRYVYSFGPRLVIKVHYDEYGLTDNDWEAGQFRRYGRKPDMDGIVRAWCKLLPNGCLLMERVNTKFLEKPECPAWADYIDGWQVGRAIRDGLIVAYDYGFH